MCSLLEETGGRAKGETGTTPGERCVHSLEVQSPCQPRKYQDSDELWDLPILWIHIKPDMTKCMSIMTYTKPDHNCHHAPRLNGGEMG